MEKELKEAIGILKTTSKNILTWKEELKLPSSKAIGYRT